MHAEQSELAEVFGQLADRQIADFEPFRDVGEDVLAAKLANRVAHRDLVVRQRCVQAQRVLRIEGGEGATAHGFILPPQKSRPRLPRETSVEGRGMRPLLRISAVFALTAVLAPPAVADPVDPIPGTGFFVVGPDIAPGLYRTGGSGSTFGVWINNVPTQDSMCSWFTYSTPDAAKDHVLQTNTSVGPMFANVNTGVKAFESQNCQPWTRVP